MGNDRFGQTFAFKRQSRVGIWYAKEDEYWPLAHSSGSRSW